jgi:CPA1 family monovalent cation:H+ antiporter
MMLFELVIALLLIGAVLSLWAGRVGVPYPALLALAGAVLALVPGVPEARLDPELALALFVAPTLLDAAYDASPRDLRDNLLPVAGLAVVLVGLTVIAVAIVARLVVPTMGWPAAIALGAIVGPSDAPAALAVLRQVGPPHRVFVILEGESLFNDATALLTYRAAVAAAMTGAFSGWTLAPMLALTCGGGIVAGILFAKAFLWLSESVQDIPISVLTQFISTFAVWIVADWVGLSAILTVISFAMTVARYAPARVDARRRIASYAVWEVTVFVLNVLAFVLIGLQLRGILTRLEGSDWRPYVLCALAVCLAVVLIRIAWVMSYNTVYRWKIRRFGVRLRRPMSLPTVGSGLVISWCGMRGIVTLATALALPNGESGATFPYRDLIVLCAFSVVLVTLLVQGMTLRPLVLRLGLRDDGLVAREIALARAETAREALRVLNEDPSRSAAVLREEYESRLRSGAGEDTAATGNSSHLAAIQRRAVQAQRQLLMGLRARDVIGDEAFHAAEEELDLLELTADPRVRAIAEDGG